MKKRNMQQGFTLIELMIVIAIVAILVALAVPAYQDYTIRAKVGECINGAAVAKLSISEYYETTGGWPTSAAAAVVNSPTDSSGVSKFCDGFANYVTTTGEFTINVNEAAVGVAAGQTIDPQLYPVPNGQGGVDWFCQQGPNTNALSVKYLPSTCRVTDS